MKNQSLYLKKLKETVKFLKGRFGAPPDLAVVFGSGLGAGYMAQCKAQSSIPFNKVPHFSAVAVAGHAGTLTLCPALKKNGQTILCLQGRRHYYEGIDPWEVVFPIRALAAWGIPHLLLTNASGALTPRLKAGTLACLTDHINLMGFNPLLGPNLDALGPRFPSLNGLYNNSLSRSIKRSCKACGLKLPGGIYVAISGPSYETPAEVAAYRLLGGDLVGMSTVPEAIAATHSGMQVAAVAAVTNSCVQKGTPPSHDAVLRYARKVDDQLTKLLLRLQQDGIRP